MAKQKNMALANGLKFIASLIFLYVVFLSGPTVGVAAGALWAPLLYAVAVIGSITLFFASLVGFVMSSDMLDMATKKANLWVALAIVAWTAISGAPFAMPMVLAVVAYVIGWFGVGAAQM